MGRHQSIFIMFTDAFSCINHKQIYPLSHFYLNHIYWDRETPCTLQQTAHLVLWYSCCVSREAWGLLDPEVWGMLLLQNIYYRHGLAVSAVPAETARP